MSAGHMNIAQAIAYYTFEVLAVLIIGCTLAFVAVLAIGALMDRYQRIFRGIDTDGDASNSAPITPASQNGHIR